MGKRVFDLFFSFILILLLLPVYAFISILVFFSVGRPIIFRQVRPGLHGKLFEIYKFRTMTSEKDEYGILLPDEHRLTRVGRFLRSASLDELPQLFNVLKGDMSFVGPRPLLEEYLSLYNEKQRKRHNVKPGITGWAQVNGRNAISWEEKFELDVWYVENQSFWLDMIILWMTFINVIRGRDISSGSSATVEKFKG